MIALLAMILAQPAPPPLVVRWTTDGGSVTAIVGSTVKSVSTMSGGSSGTNTGDQTKTCSADQWLSTLATGTSSVCMAVANFPSGSLVSRLPLNPGVRIWNDTCFAVGVIGGIAVTAPSFTAGVVELMER